MKTKRLNHSVYQHQYHIVWGTKFRRKYLKPYVQKEFEDAVYELIKKKHPTLFVQTMNVDEDHVHMQIEIPPNIRVSDAVKRIKWRTSIVLKKKFKFINRMYISGSIWSIGYYSSTIGINEETIRNYIKYQGKKDLPQTLPMTFS